MDRQAEELLAALNEAGIDPNTAAAHMGIRLKHADWVDGKVTRDEFITYCREVNRQLTLRKRG